MTNSTVKRPRMTEVEYKKIQALLNLDFTHRQINTALGKDRSAGVYSNIRKSTDFEDYIEKQRAENDKYRKSREIRALEFPREKAIETVSVETETPAKTSSTKPFEEDLLQILQNINDTLVELVKAWDSKRRLF